MAGPDFLARYRRPVEKLLASLHPPDYKLALAALEAVEGGKRIRSAISLLVCEAVCGRYEPAVPVGAVYELAHAASLVQDDIIDDSALRHSKPSVYKRYGQIMAVLVSDILIFDIFQQFAKYSGTKVTKKRLGELLGHVARAASLTIKGEYKEMGLSVRNLTEETYVEVVGLKTGALYAAAAASGALAGGAGPKVTKAMYDFGYCLGISYQVRDDILDVVGERGNTGKPSLKDISNDACNIVVGHALSVANPLQKQHILSMLLRRLYSKSEVERLVATVTDLGSLEYADGLARRYAARSMERLSTLKPSPARTKLQRLVRELEGRWT
ncbi:MAG: polyprenyl synthetase family protein, partial [Nitrososphaerota archaeon]|nr:polyprenyl synthetase family protein [Nitrososphaerota archaeon]